MDFLLFVIFWPHFQTPKVAKPLEISSENISCITGKIVNIASCLLQVKSTLQYEPGRKYEVKVGKKVKYLREERIGGRPESFKKLDEWLVDRRLELADFLRATSEAAVVEERVVSGEEEEEEFELGEEEDFASSVEDDSSAEEFDSD